jgi:hypothetical protein
MNFFISSPSFSSASAGRPTLDLFVTGALIGRFVAGELQGRSAGRREYGDDQVSRRKYYPASASTHSTSARYGAAIRCARTATYWTRRGGLPVSRRPTCAVSHLRASVGILC